MHTSHNQVLSVPYLSKFDPPQKTSEQKIISRTLYTRKNDLQVNRANSSKTSRAKEHKPREQQKCKSQQSRISKEKIIPDPIVYSIC